MKTQIVILKNGKTYSVQIWIDKLKSWLVFDNFKTRKLAKEFIHDKKEQEEVKLYIKKAVMGAEALKKKQNENKRKTIEHKRSVRRKKI